MTTSEQGALVLTAPQRRCLNALLVLVDDPAQPRRPGWERTATSGEIAQALWPSSVGWEQPHDAVMPMKAAQVLWRLADKGLAVRDPNLTDANGWTVTAFGRRWMGVSDA